MLDYHLFTNQGDRDNNEDFIVAHILDDRACFILNDGLGGQGHGEEASSLVAEVIGEKFKKDYKKEDFLETAFSAAQDRLKARQKEAGLSHSMMTTSVVLVLDGDEARWGHIGDSRLYQFEDGVITGRTIDHSVPQMLALSGEIKEEEIRFHEDRNRILKAMGTDWEKFEPVIARPIKVHKGVSFLLCTDGFWELIDEAGMMKYLKETGSAREWVENMGAYVCERESGSSHDNTSAIGIQIK
ncbi:MAG: protein phosphatase 2C domain-containing protein [Lachnospiraceae bacterium]|nr:protein phosphatase 2C domain-containing protein [Lachnospiraceae bacterium]